VWRASALGAVATLRPGTLFAVDDALAVACGEGALLLDEVQLAGRQRMSIAQLLRGHAGLLSAGMCLE
ncbi:MAG TPA: methionyl-tRNA formyltransferase, partial [Porticoccaceae bacterium]|nr:methionyl-tRNA formyltransferase [Porticoccaceae bacterium]